MKRYYIDACNIICLDGIRYVQKADSRYDDGFYFTVTYKGNHTNCKYTDRASRDKAFEELITLIEERNKK